MASEDVVDVAQAIQSRTIQTLFVACGDRLFEKIFDGRLVTLQLKSAGQRRSIHRSAQGPPKINQLGERLESASRINRLQFRKRRIEQQLSQVVAVLGELAANGVRQRDDRIGAWSKKSAG